MSRHYTVIQWQQAGEAVNLAVALFNADGQLIGWRKTLNDERIEHFTGMSMAALDPAIDDLLGRTPAELGELAGNPRVRVRPTALLPTTEDEGVLDMLIGTFLVNRPPTPEDPS